METAHYVVSYGNLFGGHSWGRGRTGLTDAGALSPPESPSVQHEAISIISLVVFGLPGLNPTNKFTNEGWMEEVEHEQGRFLTGPGGPTSCSSSAGGRPKGRVGTPQVPAAQDFVWVDRRSDEEFQETQAHNESASARVACCLHGHSPSSYVKTFLGEPSL